MKAGRIAFVAMLAFAVFVLLLLSGYFGAYVALGTYDDWGGVEVERTYPELWMTEFFRPAAVVESELTGCPVYLSFVHR